MAIGAPNIGSPVFAAAIITMGLLARMARKACLRYLFRVLVPEGDYPLWVGCILKVEAPRPVARFAALCLILPTRDLPQFGMLCGRETLGLVLVARLASLTSDIIVGAGTWWKSNFLHGRTGCIAPFKAVHRPDQKKEREQH